MKNTRPNTLACSTAAVRPIFGRLPLKAAMLGLSSILALLWLAGCASVDSKPFIEFNAATSEIATVDASVDAHTSKVKERELTEMALDSDKVPKLTLAFDPNDDFKHQYKFSMDEEPLFVKWERVESGLSEVNQLFIEYTRLLAQLASGDLIEIEEFDRLAADLNDNARNALNRIGHAPDASTLALFSTAAGTAAHSYISMKRKQYLIDIINGNQPVVDAYIAAAREAVGILANDIKAENQILNRRLLTEWANAPATADKKKIAGRIYTNSEITGRTLDMLKALDKAYASFANTHRSLATGLAQNVFSVSELAANIRRVQQLHDELKKANEKAAQSTT